MPETYSTISMDLGFYVDETYAMQAIVNPRDEVFFWNTEGFDQRSPRL